MFKTKLIIWDEAPMTHSHLFVVVSGLLCDITKCQEPFGGKVILLGGDFRIATKDCSNPMKDDSHWLKTLSCEFQCTLTDYVSPYSDYLSSNA